MFFRQSQAALGVIERDRRLAAQSVKNRGIVAAVSLRMHAAGIRSLVAELADQEAPILAASEPLLEAAE